MKVKWRQGSYTVEMVFLFPVIIFVTLGLIYLTFYLHDQSVLRNYVDTILFRGSNLLRHVSESDTGMVHYRNINSRSIFFPMGDEAEKMLLDEIDSGYLYQKFFLKGKINMDMSLEYNKIAAVIKGSAEIPGIPLVKYFGDILSNYKRQRTGEIYNPAEFVWKLSAAAELTGGIKGVEKQIRGLQDFIRKIR